METYSDLNGKISNIRELLHAATTLAKRNSAADIRRFNTKGAPLDATLRTDADFEGCSILLFGSRYESPLTAVVLSMTYSPLRQEWMLEVAENNAALRRWDRSTRLPSDVHPFVVPMTSIEGQTNRLYRMLLKASLRHYESLASRVEVGRRRSTAPSFRVFFPLKVAYAS